MIAVEPIALSDDTAVLRRRDYHPLMAEVRAPEAAGDAEYVPVDLSERIFVGGEHPVRVWREHRGLTLGALANPSGTAQSYISEIENGRNAARSALWLRSKALRGRHRGSPGAPER